MKSHRDQISIVADANGWQVSSRGPLEQWYHVAYQRGAHRVVVRYNINGGISVANIKDGTGVVYEPKRGKFREVLVELSAVSDVAARERFNAAIMSSSPKLWREGE